MKKLLRLLVLLPMFTFAYQPNLIQETNVIRAKAKLQPLVESTILNRIALEECTYWSKRKMNTKLFLNHDRPNLTMNQRYTSRLSGFAGNIDVGENQAYLPAGIKYASKEFYASKPHRLNLLDRAYTMM